MKQYQDAVREILKRGTRKENRTGVDTISTFNVNYNIDLRDGFPLLTTKEIKWKNIVAENLWFLSGEPKIDVLKKHGCKFWDAWADKEGNVPSAYGNFWRRFPVHETKAVEYPITRTSPQESLEPGFNDQIAWAINSLRKSPMSRRVVVSAWAPGNAQSSALPPCHIVMVLNVQNLPENCIKCNGSGTFWYAEDDSICEECKGDGVRKDKVQSHLCLHLTQRSCDIGLGVPYNIAGYAFLLELFSRFINLPAGIFGHTLVDAHAYTSKPDGSKAEYDHIPGLKEQLTREPRKLSRLKIDPSIKELDDINRLLTADTEEVMKHFVLEGYDPHPAIKFKVAV
jgi:thymidylate synthase